MAVGKLIISRPNNRNQQQLSYLLKLGLAPLITVKPVYKALVSYTFLRNCEKKFKLLEFTTKGRGKKTEKKGITLEVRILLAVLDRFCWFKKI